MKAPGAHTRKCATEAPRIPKGKKNKKIKEVQFPKEAQFTLISGAEA